MDTDIYRISLSVDGSGWSARNLNALASVTPGESRDVTVFVRRENGGAPSGSLTLQATSESDPSKTSAVTVRLSGS